jgi:hypothetical protein
MSFGGFEFVVAYPDADTAPDTEPEPEVKPTPAELEVKPTPAEPEVNPTPAETAPAKRLEVDDRADTPETPAEELKVAAGDKVTVGQTLGAVGNSAPMESAIGGHVHFSVRCNDQPMDPTAFFNLE